MPALTTIVAYHSGNFQYSVAWYCIKEDEQLNLMYKIKVKLYMGGSLQPDGVSRYTTSSPLYYCVNKIWVAGRQQRDAGVESGATCYTLLPPRYDREILKPLVREYSKEYTDKPRLNLLVKDSSWCSYMCYLAL